MHAYHTIAAAEAAGANAAIIHAFGAVGLAFSIPLYAHDAADDSTPIRMACAPEYTAPGWQAAVSALQSAFPNSTTDLYDLSKGDPSPIAARLAALGLRTAKPHLAP